MIRIQSSAKRGRKNNWDKLTLIREYSETKNQAIRYSSMVFALRLLIFNLNSPSVTTLRDIYYRDITAFNGNQENLNMALQRICESLRLYMADDLNIIPSTKGVIWGGPEIKLHFSSTFTLDLKFDHDLSIIPNFKDLKSISLYKGIDVILILEKEAILRSFSDFIKASNLTVVLVSGKGFPDHATRTAIQIIREKLPEVPMLGFFDSDVYGLRIFWNYVYTCKGHVPKIQLAGAFLFEHEREFLTIAKREWKLIMNFLKEIIALNYSDRDLCNINLVRRELTRGMLLAKKAEINAICNPLRANDLNNYLLRKVLYILNR